MKNYPSNITLFILPLIILALLFINMRINNILELLAGYASDQVTHELQQDVKSLSGDITEVNDRIDYLRKDLHDSIQNIRSESASHIYDLEITICRLDKEHDEIHKRKVIMNNIIAINPTVERTAVMVETGLQY